MLCLLIAAAALTAAAPSHAGYVPNHKDSGWVRLFNGKDLTGWYPFLPGSQWGQWGQWDKDPNRIVTVHDSMIHILQGWLRKDHPSGPPTGVLSTDVEFGYYELHMDSRPGDYPANFDWNNSGWINGDPYNSGFHFHCKVNDKSKYAGLFPLGIESQIKPHWNSTTNRPCTAAARDCNQLWDGDIWAIEGVQITNKNGQLTALSGCCNPAYANHNPDYEVEGWNSTNAAVYGDSLFILYLNGHEVNRGTKATWQNPQGQRVPLKKGLIQLEAAEGSEYLFKNIEIRLFKQNSLYSIWYKEGCLDPAYQEYNQDANLHVASMCKTPATTILDKGNLEMREPGTYDISVHDVHGRLVTRYQARGPAHFAADRGLKPGIYFLDVRKGTHSWRMRMERL